jgi:hypothetical protein
MSLLSRLRRTVPLLAGFLLAGSLAHAEPPQIDYSAVEADPALWRISDADSQVYIFGTFHILPRSLDWKTQTVLDALERADTLYLEADVQSADAQARMQALIPQYGLNPPGVTLSSMLDEETEALLADFAPTVGASPAMLDPMRPWLAQLVLTVGQIQTLGFDPNAGVELSLLTETRGTGIGYGYFETAEEQIGFLAGLPLEIQVEGLAQGLREAEALPQQVDDMVRAWATGDMVALDAYINRDMREDSPEVYEAIIVRRNANWVPQIVDILNGEGTAFIAVGAAHLPGENGIIELLRKEGLEVVRQ